MKFNPIAMIPWKMHFARCVFSTNTTTTKKPIITLKIGFKLFMMKLNANLFLDNDIVRHQEFPEAISFKLTAIFHTCTHPPDPQLFFFLFNTFIVVESRTFVCTFTLSLITGFYSFFFLFFSKVFQGFSFLVSLLCS